jgi:hypothetical protein
MKLSEEQRIFTRHIGCLIGYAYCQGMELTFGDAFRSSEEQARLYSAGKSKIKSGGNHGKRLAVDFNLFVNGNLSWEWDHYKVLGDYWESLDDNNRWGGDWNKDDLKNGFIDSPHFERHIS